MRVRKVRPESRGVDLYFSDYFGVQRRTIEKYGALDISLVADLPLFIDPFLLFKSRRPVYRQLHDRIIEYLRFLRDRASDKDGDAALLKSWYTFPEVKQTWLGFSRSGNRGAGLGRDFAGALHGNLHTIFHNFGDERITKSSHLEKLCLIKEGVGRDKISDFTTRLTLDFLCEYTEKFAKQHVPLKLRKRFAVDRVAFNYDLERWMPKTYTLPGFQGDFVLLTPLNILTKDENWINRPDLFDDFEEIPNAIPDDALRAQVNNYFKRMLPRDPKKEDTARAIDATIKQFPALIDYYIRYKEEHGDEAVRVSRTKVQYSERVFLDQAGRLAALLARETRFYQVSGDTYTEAMERVRYLKHVIEDRGGYRLFYHQGQPIEREADVHVLYDLVWRGTPSDLNKEVNDGRGPVDFSVSRGAADKTVVEFKLATNTKLKRNLEKQAEIYKKSSRAQKTIKAIVYFTKQQETRLRAVLKELKLDTAENVVLIDARSDNKVSGSRA